MLYKTEWHESGNKLQDFGYIRRVKYPLPLWIMEQLLLRHPHWGWLDKLSKDYGNPLCAAYCFPWSNFYYKHEIEEVSVRVTFDKLSRKFRDLYSKAENQ